MQIGGSLGMTINRWNRLNSANISQAVARLSSGLRINQASEDAAGLQISDSLTSEIRGTAQAIRNVQEGLNMLQTADGAFGSITNMLQRMRQLCVQAANGTMDLNDRMAIQSELDALKSQIDDTAYFTTFNGQQLLTSNTKTYSPNALNFQYNSGSAPGGGWADPTAAATYLPSAGSTYQGVTYQSFQNLQAVLPSLLNGALQQAEAMTINSGLNESLLQTIGSPPGANLPFQVYFVIDPGSSKYTLSNADMLQVNLYWFLGNGASSTNISLEQAIAQGMATTLAQREDKFGSGNTTDYDAWLSAGGATASFNALRAIAPAAAAEEYQGLGLMAPGSFTFDTPTADSAFTSSATFARYLQVNYGTNALQGLINTIVQDNSGSRPTIANDVGTYLQNLTGMSKAALQTAVNTWLATASASTPSPTAWNKGAIANTSDTTAQELSSTPITLQIGADYGQELGITLSAGALGNLDFVSMVNVRDQTSSADSITTIDRALAIVDDARGKLGGYEGQLNYTLQNLQTVEENQQAANSQIRDADMANETTTLVRSKVLAQASQGALKSMLTIQKEQVDSLVKSLPTTRK